MLGNCVSCNEIFKLDIGSEIKDKPKNSMLMESASGTGGIAIIFPKRYALGVFMIVFGGFWDLISGTMFGVWIFKDSKIETFPLIFISMFSILGFTILMFGVAQVLMRVAVIAKNGKMKLVRNILGH